jgi:hypothetical protein
MLDLGGRSPLYCSTTGSPLPRRRTGHLGTKQPARCAHRTRFCLAVQRCVGAVLKTEMAFLYLSCSFHHLLPREQKRVRGREERGLGDADDGGSFALGLAIVHDCVCVCVRVCVTGQGCDMRRSCFLRCPDFPRMRRCRLPRRAVCGFCKRWDAGYGF